jgi:hypothetical protein
MNETLKKLVAENGMAAVLATLADQLREISEGVEAEGGSPDALVEGYTEISRRVLYAASDLDKLTEEHGVAC